MAQLHSTALIFNLNRYLLVDYEHSNFSISQARFDGNASPNLVATLNANQTKPIVRATPQPKTSHSLGTGAIVGIAVGAIALLVLAGLGAFFFIQRRKAKKAIAEREDDDPMAKPEMDGQGTVFPGELFGSGGKDKPDVSPGYEMEGDKSKVDMSPGYEMEGNKGKDEKSRAEVEGSKTGVEMEGGHFARKIAEMQTEGSPHAPIEMWAGSHGLYNEFETPASGRRSRAAISSGLQSSEGAPSPISTRSERHSGIIPWAQRNKPQPRLPGEDSVDEVSSPGGLDSPRSSDAGGMRSSRRAKPKSRSRTPQSQEVSSPSSESSRRDRHRKDADALTNRLEGRASRGTRPAFSPSPVDSDGQQDRWNSRLDSVQSTRSGAVSSEDISGASDRELLHPRSTRHLSRQIRDHSRSNERVRTDSDPYVSPASDDRHGRGSPRPEGNFF